MRKTYNDKWEKQVTQSEELMKKNNQQKKQQQKDLKKNQDYERVKLQNNGAANLIKNNERKKRELNAYLCSVVRNTAQR